MIVECGHCHAKYNVDEKKIPVIGVRVRCAKCQNVMFIEWKEPAPPVPEVKIEAPEAKAPPPEAPEPEPAAPAPAAVEPAKPSPVAPSKVEFPFGDRPIAQGPPEETEEKAVTETPPLSEVVKPTYQPPEPKTEQPPAFGEPTEVPTQPSIETPKPPEPELPPEAEKAVIEKIEPTKPLPPMSEEDKRWHDRAKRLAKALASDLVLYNKDKVEQGMKDGTIAQLLGREIRRSWEYYCQQIPKHIVDGTDYFKEQLNKIVGKGKEIFK